MGILKEKTFSFESHEAADKTLKVLKTIIDRYGYVSVADFYDAIGESNSISYTDSLYGWNTLNDFIISETNHEKKFKFSVLVTLPEPKPISDLGFSFKSHIIGAKNLNNVKENVNHPSHYQSETGIEVIDAIEAFTFDLEGIAAFDTGNILKYICRWNKKNGLQDLKKAEWYLQHLISHIENIEKENN